MLVKMLLARFPEVRQCWYVYSFGAGQVVTGTSCCESGQEVASCDLEELVL